MKKISPGEWIFLSIAGFFGILLLYETARMILPHYTFARASIVFLCFAILYLFLYHKKSLLTLFGVNVHRPSTRSKKSQFSQMQKFTPLYLQGLFIITSLLCILSLVLSIASLAYFGVTLFFIVYGLCSYFGFKREDAIPKIDESDMDALRFFLLSLAFFIIILHSFIEMFGLEAPVTQYIYFLASGVYTCVMYGIFYWRGFHLKLQFSVYQILSGSLISLLVIYLIIQNIFLKSSPEDISPSPTVVPPPVVQVPVTQSGTELENTPTQLVSEVFTLAVGMRVGSIGSSVINLQTVLSVLGYFDADASGDFDETTRLALVEALQTECDWPESTQGIFGPQAKECIDNLEISLP